MDQAANRRPVAEESRSQLARLLSMFHSPGRTLGELARSPAIAAALVATAAAGALEATAVSRAADLDAMVRHSYERQMEAMPGSFSRNMSDADRERTIEGLETALRLSRNFAPVLGALGGAAAPMVASGFFLLVFGILGSPGSYRLLLATVVHAGWPAAAVSSLLSLVVVWQSFPMAPDRAESPLRTSLAAAFPEVEGVAGALASRVDAFLLWEIVLTTIGFAVLLGISRRRSLAVVLSLWTLVTAAGVVVGLLSGFVNIGISGGPG